MKSFEKLLELEMKAKLANKEAMDGLACVGEAKDLFREAFESLEKVKDEIDTSVAELTHHKLKRLKEGMASTVGLYAEMYADCGLVVDEVNRSAPTVEELKEGSANTPD